MKTIKIFMLFLFASTIATAQDVRTSEVPKEVTNAFSKEFSKASDVEWERHRDGYKVEFDVGRLEHEVWYNASGVAIKKEQDIRENDLPQAVRDAIKSKYAGYRIDDVEMNWQDNATTYSVELEKGKEEWKLRLDPNGKILNERRD